MTPKRPKGRPRLNATAPVKSTPKVAKSESGVDPVLRKRLRALYRSLTDYVCDDGRQPTLVFMEKPSKKLYPDYYRIISEPIDMMTIEANIKHDKYNGLQSNISYTFAFYRSTAPCALVLAAPVP